MQDSGTQPTKQPSFVVAHAIMNSQPLGEDGDEKGDHPIAEENKGDR